MAINKTVTSHSVISQFIILSLHMPTSGTNVKTFTFGDKINFGPLKIIVLLANGRRNMFLK